MFLNFVHTREFVVNLIILPVLLAVLFLHAFSCLLSYLFAYGSGRIFSTNVIFGIALCGYNSRQGFDGFGGGVVGTFMHKELQWLHD